MKIQGNEVWFDDSDKGKQEYLWWKFLAVGFKNAILSPRAGQTFTIPSFVTLEYIKDIKPIDGVEKVLELLKSVRKDIEVMLESIVLWRELFEAFPPLDPASEFYDEPVNGADVISWISEHAKHIRDMLNVLTKEGKE